MASTVTILSGATWWMHQEMHFLQQTMVFWRPFPNPPVSRWPYWAFSS